MDALAIYTDEQLMAELARRKEQREIKDIIKKNKELYAAIPLRNGLTEKSVEEFVLSNGGATAEQIAKHFDYDESFLHLHDVVGYRCLVSNRYIYKKKMNSKIWYSKNDGKWKGCERGCEEIGFRGKFTPYDCQCYHTLKEIKY